MIKKKDEQYWIGFDLGGTKMYAAVFDSDFNIIARRRRKTKGREGQEKGWGRIVRSIEKVMEKAEVRPEQVAGIGIGSPGPLNLKSGVLAELPNMGWKDVPIKQELEAKFGVPVAVLNDVDAGVYGEYAYGAGKGARCLVGVFPGTGIGGGCVYEGEILRGKEMSCLEIGHLQVLPGGPLCGCGRHGCLEAVASRLAISAAATATAFRGQAPNLLAIAGMDLSVIRSTTLAKAIEAGDTVIETIVRDGARWLGVGIGAVVNLLAPDVVILGGGLVEAMPDLYRDEVERTARRKAMSAFRDTFEVVTAKLGDDAAVFGAAAWVRHIVKRKTGSPSRKKKE